MKKLLKKIENELFYFENGNKILGANKNLRGDCSGLRGDLDLCEISKKERKNGINIIDLIGENK